MKIIAIIAALVKHPFRIHPHFEEYFHYTNPIYVSYLNFYIVILLSAFNQYISHTYAHVSYGYY